MQLTMRNSRNKAFTLIELITVVALIGMMAIFVMPNFSRTVSRSHARAATNNLMILYANQKIKFNSGNGYQAAANNAELTANLNFTPMADEFTYTCTVAGPPQAFNCQAAHAGGDYTLRVSDVEPSVSCGAGTCPSIGGALAGGGPTAGEPVGEGTPGGQGGEGGQGDLGV